MASPQRKKRKILEITTDKLQHGDPNLNKKFIDILKEVGEFEKIQGNMIKSKVYSRAVKVLQTLDHEVTSGAEAQQYDGIGKKIGKKIDEIIETGALKKLDKLNANEELKSARLFQGVSGIGPAAAAKFVKEGYRTLEDLSKAKLNHHQQIGLKHYKDFNLRIPRKEVEEIEKIVTKILKKLDSSYIGKACGSYRRGSADSGDVDILITHRKHTTSSKDDKMLENIVNKLQSIGLLTDHISRGKSKYMGVCKLEGSNHYRRIDLRVIPYENYWCGLLYFTGSDFFNQQMRTIALEKGYTLNEYEICPVGETGTKGEPLEVHSEEDIFEIIGMEYKSPKERNL